MTYPLRVFVSTCLILCSSAFGAVDFSTMDGKVMVGYQGWHWCAGDGSPRNDWNHWSPKGQAPSPTNYEFDQFPDLSEYSETYNTNLYYRDGKRVKLYSAADYSTVDVHFRWMKEYNIDGAFVQRFVHEVKNLNESKAKTRDMVLEHAMQASKKYGRAISVMWDISDLSNSDYPAELQQDLKHLKDTLDVFDGSNYLHHNGKPVISIWGFGGLTRNPSDPNVALAVINWLKGEGFTVMGGVPTHWLDLDGDSRTNSGWRAVYAAFDVVSPWMVGRLTDLGDVDEAKTKYYDPEIKYLNSLPNKPDYMPCIYPGYSRINGDGSLNQNPRLGGQFMWKQAYNAKKAGAKMLYIGMYDEVDEGTAIYKTASKKEDCPRDSQWLSHDLDGYDLPTDWYLTLAGEINDMLKGVDSTVSFYPKLKALIDGKLSEPPTVRFVSPSTDINLKVGDNLSVEVSAVDADGIDRVYLYKDDVELVGNEGGAPYQWNEPGQRVDPELLNLKAGKFVLKAKAKDKSGAWGEDSITVTVESINSVSVANFLSPNGNVTITEGENLYVNLTASDSDGVERIKLYKDGVEVSSDSSDPYEWNLQNLPVGTFHLTAKLKDNLGNHTDATNSITVTVAAPPLSSVSVASFLIPDRDVTMTEGEDLYVRVSGLDTDGVERIKLYQDGLEISSDSTEPYEWNLANLPVGSFELTAKLKDNLGNYTDADTSIQVTTVSQFQNLVENHSFEEVIDPAVWDLSANYKRSSEARDDGAYSLKGTGSGRLGNARQTLDLEPNTNYKISFRVKFLSGGSGRIVFDTSDKFDPQTSPGGDGQEIISIANGEWVTYDSRSFNSASVTSVTIRFFTQLDFSGTFYIDNVVVKEVADATFVINESTDPDSSPYILEGYDEWANVMGIGAEIDDYDHDGQCNLYEYALGGNPTNPLDAGVEPKIEYMDGALSYSFMQRKDDTELHYTVETRASMATSNWSPTVYTLMDRNEGEAAYDEVVYTVPMNDDGVMIRLKVTN